MDAGDLDAVAELFGHGRIPGQEGGPFGTLFEGYDDVRPLYERPVRLHGPTPLTRHVITDPLEPRPWAWRLLNDPTTARTGEVGAVLRSSTTGWPPSGSRVGEPMRRAGDHDPLYVEAMKAVWSSTSDALVSRWAAHPEESPDAMSRHCVRLFTAVLGPIDVALPS